VSKVERYAFRTTKDSADRVIDEELSKYPKARGIQSARIRELVKLGLLFESANVQQRILVQTPTNEAMEAFKREWYKIHPGTATITTPMEYREITHEPPTEDLVKNNLLGDDFE
jgi:hypothetical protein